MGQVGQIFENRKDKVPILADPLHHIEVVYTEDYITNRRGVQLFTCQWLPMGQEARALVFLCHGYGMECSVFMKDTGERLARAGYGVFGIDYEGHGKSKGKRCYISNFPNIIGDAASYFVRVQNRKEHQGKESFIYGESMGGAVALLLTRKEPFRWKGMVLVAPMAKIADKMKPSPFIIDALSKLNRLIPTWKLVPTPDIFESAFKVPRKRQEIKANKLLYQDKPRISTALELYKATLDLEGRLDEVTLPFLLLHGEDDTVTDPEVSKSLFDQSKSFDKTMKLYEGLWHGLTSGEEDKDINMVFNDIIQWLNDRSKTCSPHSRTKSGSSGSSTVSSSGSRESWFQKRQLTNWTSDELKSKGHCDISVQPGEALTSCPYPRSASFPRYVG